MQSTVVDKYFVGTPSRIEGAGMDVIATEVQSRHQAAFPDRLTQEQTLDVGGRFQYRAAGEYHLFNPATIHRLQQAVRQDNFEAGYRLYRSYATAVNDHDKQFATLRGLMGFKLDPSTAVPLDEVEPAEQYLHG